MSVQQNVRLILADAIESYLDEEYTNDQLEGVIRQIWGLEKVSTNIANVMLVFSSEFMTHKNTGRHKIPDNMVEIVRKWIALLRSNCDWPVSVGDILAGDSSEAIRKQAIEDVDWPFDSKSGWDKLSE